MVCFAGAVMANTLKLDPTKMEVPSTMDQDTMCKLYALDHFRNGLLGPGLQELVISGSFNGNGGEINYNAWPIKQIPDYDEDRDGFVEGMQELIGFFRYINW